MRTHKIIWEKKGHTKIRLPQEDLVTHAHWTPEIYDSGVEYLIYINPSLREKKTFLCNINISNRNHTYESTMMVKEDGGGYVRKLCRIMHSALYANIDEGRDNYSIHTYSNPGRRLSDQILMESMDLFMLARNEFYRIFRRDEDNTDNS